MGSQTLRARWKALEALWEQGLAGHRLLQQHTALVDQFIIDHFQAVMAEQKGKGRVTLVALGGYGRCELYPYSDIDLLLLHDRRGDKGIQAVAEGVLYPLWDAKFEVGHSVRRVKDALQFAASDFIFQLSLLDSRFLAGDQELYEELTQGYRKKLIDGRRRQFVKAMEIACSERRKKFGSHAYLLEPQLKDGKGGMRDIQSMLWTANAVFGLRDYTALQESGLASEEELAAFDASWNMLAQIRNRLHYLSRRKNDRLNFEYQRDVAVAFGFQDEGNLLGVEHFMREVYGHLQTIAVITERFFEHAREVSGLNEGEARPKRLEKGIVQRHGCIRLENPVELTARPVLLMRLFLRAGREGVPLHHQTRRLVTDHLHIIDEKFSHSRNVARVFFDILTQSPAVERVLEMMLETGVLGAYLPEVAGVASLAQHDLYHVFTVDRHQLRTVHELVTLREQEFSLFSALSAPRLLLLAGLLHDIGKGKGGDHSKIGAEMVKAVGVRLGLTVSEQDLLSFLVRYHLFLPESSLRRDPDDADFIQYAAALIGDTESLTMLYLLSIADSKATGPAAWSDWKKSVMGELYRRLFDYLSNHPALTAEQEVIRVEKQLVGYQQGVEETAIAVGETHFKLAVADLPSDYLTYCLPNMVVAHLCIHRDQQARLSQQVLLKAKAGEKAWELLLMSKDRPGLLAKFCGVLALHRLNVRSARIFTWPDHSVVDLLEVAPVTQGCGFADQDWQKLENDLNQALNYRLDVGTQVHKKLFASGAAQRQRQKAVQKTECKVVFDHMSSERFTIIEVHAPDQPGSIYLFAQTLSDFGLSIHRAKIATELEQLIDVFYVATATGEKLIDPVLAGKIETALLSRMQAGVEER